MNHRIPRRHRDAGRARRLLAGAQRRGRVRAVSLYVLLVVVGLLAALVALVALVASLSA
jgi:hypothetical protein